MVRLDGSASTDPDSGDKLTYAWRQTSTPSVVLNNATSPVATFTAPRVSTNTVMFFTLTVKDAAGLTDSATVKVTVNHETQSSAIGNDKDPFGVKEIYQTKQGGEEWYMNMNNPSSDSRNNPPPLTKNADGSFKVTSNQVRWGVFTSAGYHPELITTTNQKQLAAQGFMQSPNDWKNVEMTGYVKVNQFSGSDFPFTWYARGARDTDSAPCEGTSINGRLFTDGTTNFAKEQWHTGGNFFTSVKPATDAVNTKWIGFKTIIYNLEENGKTEVKMESWVDKNNDNTWVKVDDFVDRGGFGNQGGHCGGDPDQIITWGGPDAVFRWDGQTDVDVKNLSVREIQAT